MPVICVIRTLELILKNNGYFFALVVYLKRKPSSSSQGTEINFYAVRHSSTEFLQGVQRNLRCSEMSRGFAESRA